MEHLVTLEYTNTHIYTYLCLYGCNLGSSSLLPPTLITSVWWKQSKSLLAFWDTQYTIAICIHPPVPYLATHWSIFPHLFLSIPSSASGNHHSTLGFYKINFLTFHVHMRSCSACLLVPGLFYFRNNLQFCPFVINDRIAFSLWLHSIPSCVHTAFSLSFTHWRLVSVFLFFS